MYGHELDIAPGSFIEGQRGSTLGCRGSVDTDHNGRLPAFGPQLFAHYGDGAMCMVDEPGADRSEHCPGQLALAARTDHDDRELFTEIAKHGHDRAARRLG